MDYVAEGRLSKMSREKAWATIEELARYEDEGWNDPILLEEGSLYYKSLNIKQLLRVMECKVDMLMKNAISLMGRSEDEAFEDLVMNFIHDQEEKVKQLEEYMCVIGNDFMQFSSKVIKRLKEEIRIKENGVKKIEKIMREIPSDGEPEAKLLPNFSPLNVNLGDKRGTDPPIKPHSPDSFRMKVVDKSTINTPPSPHVVSFHPKDTMRSSMEICILKGLLEHTSASQQQVQSTCSTFAIDLRSCSRIYIMGLPKFTRPKGCHQELSSNFYVANCGPAVGLTLDFITSAFSLYRIVKGVYLADESGFCVIVSYNDETSAQTALNALDRKPCSDLGAHVSLEALEMNIPRVYLIHEFISGQEEEHPLTAVDVRPWHNLEKRRIQHYEEKQKEVIVEKVGEPTESHGDFVACLSDSECCNSPKI
ncbi:alkylated DNA repair protein AlkB homolog 8 isoform X1 [Tanacetum coccineum]